MQGQRTDIEWNTGKGIEVGDKVQYTDNWFLAFLGYLPESRVEYEVLNVFDWPNHEYARIVIGAYGKAGTNGMYESETFLKNLELVSKGHKPLKDLGPLV